MTDFILKSLKGINEILFPPVCLRCGVRRTLPDQYMCPFCLDVGFEEANPQDVPNASGEILPLKVDFQDAMWSYQKGGALQQLMYHLKYNHNANLGKQLGILAAHCCKKRPFMKSWLKRDIDVVIVPIPLHRTKMRVRGFNQARRIAEGVAEVLELEVIDPGIIRRVKKTVTQTGFSFQARLQNMRNAFKVQQTGRISQCRQLIVDDVFTTGSTVFEMANELRIHHSSGIGILTVAQA